MKGKALEEQNKANQLKEWDKKHFLHPTSPLRAQQENGPAHVFTEGKGIYLTDVDGKRYIDGLSALWNVNLGYGRSDIAEAAKEQMETLPFVSSFNNYSNEPAIRLSRKIAEVSPGDLTVSFFTSGGSESNETAFKLIRYYWKLKGHPERRKVISINRAYHGVTMGATQATGMDTFSEFATAPAPDFLQAKPFLTECEQGDKNHPDYEHSIRGVIEREGAETVAAVIVEPIQGAGGVNVPPPGYLQALRDLCDEHGIFMISDEIICGFGRTGTLFGMENWDVIPDMMTVAKGITSGYIPLGAVVMKEDFRDELSDLSDGVLFHGFTYSGHATSCATALKTIEILEKDKIISHTKEMEAVVLEGFKKLEKQHPYVTNIRSVGLLGGFDLFKDPSSSTPFDPEDEAAPFVAKECNRRGLIVRPVVYKGANTISFAPPLVTEKKQIEEVMTIFSEAVSAFEKNR
ncbi:aminotransferase family protein [Salibacterium sp. K-3]